MAFAEMFTSVGSIIGSLVFVWAIFQQYFPFELRACFEKYSQKFAGFFYPYIQITFNEFTGEGFTRSEAYIAIQNYLTRNSSSQAKRLKADSLHNNHSLILTMDDHEQVAEQFSGVKLWWSSGKQISQSQTISFHPGSEEKKFFMLTFHRRHRDLVIGQYLNHVMKEGKAIKVKNRQRKLFTNQDADWSHVVFEHPATFRTLAMKPEKKKEIIEDLIAFSQAEEFYKEIGRAWKRGYLLYGPPGTGKSTMIAAMANLLGYDIYDLELTSVKNNIELRRLLTEISSKSVVVIEDIDCSLDLTGQRMKRNNRERGRAETEMDPMIKMAMKEFSDSNPSEVTLSGLLNFIDGLWSACGGERLIVFTTNYVEKLDPALIRKGRMDKLIEMSFCGFEAFKVLAKNYLKLDSHPLFSKIEKLLGETRITPADVAEHLMPKAVSGDPRVCLESLIEALEELKEEERVKAEQYQKEKQEPAAEL
ncbi:AAA-ATPase ASD, mitochondrial-like [Momordica charantia]|uniref:AAA-ATPase ASD, mitochondrial-like n=1 Tax=Momordica charantia TaxID=3673 RepID=A0A6J1BY70_MOMCH|nr:AAA-ATPase ASD, mitochondrial-like [Momordica charantia]